MLCYAICRHAATPAAVVDFRRLISPPQRCELAPAADAATTMRSLRAASAQRASSQQRERTRRCADADARRSVIAASARERAASAMRVMLLSALPPRYCHAARAMALRLLLFAFQRCEARYAMPMPAARDAR